MRRYGVHLMLPAFLAFSLFAHPAVAEPMTSSRVAPTASATLASRAPQLPTINSALTRPLSPRVYGRVESAVDTDDLVSAKLALRRANRAIGFGIAGLIVGPLLVVVGVFMLPTVILTITGVIFIIWGGVWFLISLPVFIMGLIGKGVSRARLDELEVESETEASWTPMNPLPRHALSVPVLRF